MRPSLFLFLYLGSVTFVAAQTNLPAPPAAQNFIANGGFEAGFRRENLWDGVDTTGFLASERGALPVLTTSGMISDTAMPVSVSVADLSGDGLLDLAVMDVLGYLRIYFNSGTKTEPKFTLAELSTLFLSRVRAGDPTLQGITAIHARQGQRIHLTDILRSGKKDLILGNYLGEIMIVPNAGSAIRPEFRQPQTVAQVLIPTMKDSLKKWGNVFAPVTWDWNRDSRDDLLVGEGSYSANSIHLLLNQGSGRPVFDENNRSVLAYGMGLEQLSPCVVDYNGDGVQDLLVTERTGKVAVYLSGSTPWKPGEDIPFDSFISLGGAAQTPAQSADKDPLSAAKASGLLSIGGIATIAQGDFNGDGLFDLVFGKSNGRVALSLNTGTKSQPKFGTPQDLKGDSNTPVFNFPSGWESDFGLTRGNFYGFYNVVKAADDATAKPSEGSACLKIGYVASPNKIMPVPSQFSSSTAGFNFGVLQNLTPEILAASPANFFAMTQVGRRPLAIGQTYVFSMKVKGARVSEASVLITYSIEKKRETRVERGDRGSARVSSTDLKEQKNVVAKFTVGPEWTEVRKEFTVKFDNRELSDLPTVTSWNTSICLTLAPSVGMLYVDDVKILPK